MTRKIYHEDQYIQTFSSRVIESITCNAKPGVILEETIFYPTSGGQPHDTGTLNDTAVLDVVEDEQQRIIHLLERPLVAESVQGQLDWSRRFDHMQQHTGQHLLSQVCLKLCDAETLSFHLSAESSTLDIAQADLDADTINFVEAVANQVIYENREVMAHLVSKDELSRFPVRKLPTVEKHIRIVEIDQFDYSPCGGTHCSRTGEIGMIKVTKSENYKGGSRLHFLCGGRALKDYQQKTSLLKQLSETMSSGEAELPQNVIKLQEETKTLRREQHHTTAQLLEYEAKTLIAERKQTDGCYLLKKIFEERDPKELKVLALKVLEHSPNTVILFGGKCNGKASLLFLRSEELPYHMGELMKTACAVIEGRGGGKAQQAQGGGANLEKLEEALLEAEEAVVS